MKYIKLFFIVLILGIPGTLFHTQAINLEEDKENVWIIGNFGEVESGTEEDTWVLPSMEEVSASQSPNLLSDNSQETQTSTWVIGDLLLPETTEEDSAWVIPAFEPQFSDSSNITKKTESPPPTMLASKPKEFLPPKPKRAPIVRHPDRPEPSEYIIAQPKRNKFREGYFRVQERENKKEGSLLALDKSSAEKPITTQKKSENVDGFVIPPQKQTKKPNSLFQKSTPLIPFEKNAPQEFVFPPLPSPKKQNLILNPDILKADLLSLQKTNPTRKTATFAPKNINTLITPKPQKTIVRSANDYVQAIQNFKQSNQTYLKNLESEFYSSAPDIDTRLLSWEYIDEDIMSYQLSLIQKNILKTITFAFLVLTFALLFYFLIFKFKNQIAQAILRFKFPPPWL